MPVSALRELAFVITSIRMHTEIKLAIYKIKLKPRYSFDIAAKLGLDFAGMKLILLWNKICTYTSVTFIRNVRRMLRGQELEGCPLERAFVLPFRPLQKLHGFRCSP